MGAGEARPQTDGMAKAGGGLIESTLRLIDQTEIAEKSRLVVLELNGAGDVLVGRIEFADLIGHQTEQVQRLGVIGIDLENGTIPSLGLLEPAGLVVFPRFVESLR